MAKNGFEIGKAYQHTSGMQMYICGMADTVYHGKCFIAESGWDRKLLKDRIKKAKDENEKMPIGGYDRHELSPVSLKEEAKENWSEITKEIFLYNNTYELTD